MRRTNLETTTTNIKEKNKNRNNIIYFTLRKTKVKYTSNTVIICNRRIEKAKRNQYMYNTITK
jgi:hypothetical protein